MRIFGGRLPIISTSELIDYASRSRTRTRLELCNCAELGKLVVRVVGLSRSSSKEWELGVLVDPGSADYFVAGRSVEGIKRKLDRMLNPVWEKLEFVSPTAGVLRLFQAGRVTPTRNSVPRW
jgi:hypothetical protein